MTQILDVSIGHDDLPVAQNKARGKAAVEAILAPRDSGRIKLVTQAGIRAWTREDRKVADLSAGHVAIGKTAYASPIDRTRPAPHGWPEIEVV